MAGDNPHPVTDAYSSPYCSSAVVLLAVPNCLPSCYPVLKVMSLQGEIFMDQITGNIYTYAYANKPFMSSGEIYHNMAEDLQIFLRDQNKKKH